MKNISKETKTILGIDPGTNILGYGIIRVDSKGPHYVDMGVFDLRKITDPFEKLANIFAGVGELMDEHKPDQLAVESPFYGKNAQVILKLGRAQGGIPSYTWRRFSVLTNPSTRRQKSTVQAV